MNAPTIPDGPQPPSDDSPFRAFDESVFVESAAWRHLTAILATNGGAYALSGPRGAGKSWMMQKALAEVEADGGLTLWYPSPSNYSAFEFLSTLSDNFANQIERRYRPDRFYPTLASSPWRMSAGAALVAISLLLAGTIEARNESLRTAGLTLLGAGLVVAVGLVWRSWTWRSADATGQGGDRVTPGTPPPRRATVIESAVTAACSIAITASAALIVVGIGDGPSIPVTAGRNLILAAAAFVAGFWLLLLTVRNVGRERKPEALLTREAGLLRERIRYSSRTKEGTEVAAKGGVGGVLGSLRTSREQELVERPTTIASLIHDFRLLAERAGDVSGRVVIAIDELDKIADAAAVRALLRDIKGVFEIRNVFFLVSVSDEATRALKLGGVSARDEFNSSFYTIIEVPPMTTDFRAEMLAQRRVALHPDVAACLSLLTGANPREMLRLVATVVQAGGAQDAGVAVSAVMCEEVRAFREEAMTSSSPRWPSGLSDGERRSLADALSYERLQPAKLARAASALICEWEPVWGGQFWVAQHQDRWQRLLVRLYVASRSLDPANDIDELGRILRTLDEAPVVARQAIERRFALDSPS